MLTLRLDSLWAWGKSWPLGDFLDSTGLPQGLPTNYMAVKNQSGVRFKSRALKV